MPGSTPPLTDEAAAHDRSLVARLRHLWAHRHRRTALTSLVVAGGIGLGTLAWLWHNGEGLRQTAANPVVPAAAQSPDRAVPPAAVPEIVFNWRDEAGGLHRAAVPKAAYAAYLDAAHAAVQRDRIDAVALAAQALKNETVPVFDRVQGRVSEFADWSFDWWTSWILLGRAFAWTWDDLRHGYFLALPDRVQLQLTEAIQQRFRDLALRPDTTNPQLEVAIDRSWAAADGSLARNCAASWAAFGDFVRREAQRAERRDPAQGWLPDSNWNRAQATFEPICTSRPDGILKRPDFRPTFALSKATEPVDEVILRLARPFATKLISFVVLPAIITAVIGGFVLPLFGLLPNVISGIVTGILTGAFGAVLIGFAASASVDLLLSRTDEALNRPQFEAAARKAVVAIETDFETQTIAAEARAIDDALRTMLGALSGEEPKR